jgi:hypothetical protein|tara:strand:- start:1343 stop:1624 length:282 start_codon:yes stop_codon:yes gene_type:complete
MPFKIFPLVMQGARALAKAGKDKKKVDEVKKSIESKFQAMNEGRIGKKKGGSVKAKKLTPKQKKLAAMTPPRNKITRGDIIAIAKKNKGKKRK